MSLREQKLLVANRGEIAVRILNTASKLGIRTVAVYTEADATSPHVTLADEAVLLHSEDPKPSTNSRGYLDIESIIEVCKAKNVTLVHPGYGFLSEHAAFASALEEVGITWLGPNAETIQHMGAKHAARATAVSAGVPVIPGSDGLVADAVTATETAKRVGFPVMLKSTAGGGGMGLVVCQNEDEVEKKLEPTRERAKVCGVLGLGERTC
jgi:urea carboxylase